MTEQDTQDDGIPALPAADALAAATRVPPATRLALEVPKPRNWQDFQRACVILYRAELNDPHATEYGRDGQGQRGIDILACRDGRPDHHVGIQCKRIAKPLTRAEILSHCRQALTVEAGLKEIIFATTADDDTRPTDDAVSVERALRAEGHDVRVAYYGWGALQTSIAMHPSATAIFNPAAYASTLPQTLAQPSSTPDLSAQLGRLLDIVKSQGLSLAPSDQPAPDRTDEDPALHARIDVFRDLFQKDHQYLLAERQLLDMLGNTDFSTRPWAQFRIETNLASIAMNLGREDEAVVRFETAYALLPEEGLARANLALARTLQGRTTEAMELARSALAIDPPCEVAVAYLLQAAARGDWEGDPETLIPEALADTVAAAFGLAEYLRRREVPDWPERTIELASRHPASDELKRDAALAVLELAVRDQAFIGAKGAHVTFEQVSAAAEDASELAERYLAIGYAHQHDLLASVSNASVLLRLVGRDADAEALLRAGMKVLPPDDILFRLVALCEVTQGRHGQAIATLEAATAPESRLFQSELIAVDDPGTGLDRALAVVVPPGDKRLTIMRWRLIGELALRQRRADIIDVAARGLRDAGADPLAPEFLELRWELASQSSGDPDEAHLQPVLDLAARTTDATDPLIRFELAEALLYEGEPGVAVDLLAGRVELNRATPPAILYLQALAASRRDADFDAAVAQAAPLLRDDPSILWTRTARAWNMGDLAHALTCADALVAAKPDDARAHLLRIDVLARSDRTSDLLTALDRPLERLGGARFEDRARLAGLLAFFGQLDRAIALSYRLFLEHRDLPRAWLGLSGIVLDQGRSLEDDRWGRTTVGADCAVDIEFSDGERLFLVVEPDAQLRRIDQDSFPEDHLLVCRIRGMAAGDSFEDRDGRTGTIRRIRHKYVARFHYVLDHFETRFPEEAGFRRVVLAPDTSDTLAKVLEQAKARAEWSEEESKPYFAGTWPIGLLAMRLGADVIEVAQGLAAEGKALRVASGATADLAAAGAELERHGQQGATLDLLTFWTAWRLGALDALRTRYGAIHVAQSVIDRLRTRRDRYASQVGCDQKLAHYADGKLVIVDVAPEAIVALRDEASEALAWLDAHAIVSPVIAGPDVPEILRDHLRDGRADIFDSIVLAVQTGTILICDDLFTRSLMGGLIGRSGAWLQVALRGAALCGYATLDDYARWSAALVDAGHSYLSVDGQTLASAALLDAEAGGRPGPLFRSLSTLVGGALADPRSHLNACLAFLQIVWNDERFDRCREPTTGLLLERLVRDRRADYGGMLGVIVAAARQAPSILSYMHDWLRGHFIPVEALWTTKASTRRKTGSRAKRSGRRLRGTK